MKILQGSFIIFKDNIENKHIGQVHIVHEGHYELLTLDGTEYTIPKHRQIHNYGKMPLEKFKELYPEEFI